jgi:hypothetical protein
MRWIRIALLVGLVVAAASGWLSRENPREQRVSPATTAEDYRTAPRSREPGVAA